MTAEASQIEEPAAEVAVQRRGIRKGLYLLPSAFTAANIGMGYYAIMAALRGYQVLGGGGGNEFERAMAHFDSASRAIGWAVLFDALDGRIARLTKTTTEIGIQLDSIADVVTFGIAPAVLVYAWGYGAIFQQAGALTGWDDQLHKLGWFMSFMFLICGALQARAFQRAGHAPAHARRRDGQSR